MLMVSYDISDTKLRTRFSKFLSKFGFRLQFSVFQIKNSPRMLRNIIMEIKSDFEKSFSEKDSILIFHFSAQCKKYSFGYAKNLDHELIMIE